MSRDAGQEITKEINDLCKSNGKLDLAQFGVVTNAGHHLYLDNPQEFGDKLLDFLHKRGAVLKGFLDTELIEGLDVR